MQLCEHTLCSKAVGLLNVRKRLFENVLMSFPTLKLVLLKLFTDKEPKFFRFVCLFHRSRMVQEFLLIIHKI